VCKCGPSRRTRSGRGPAGSPAAIAVHWTASLATELAGDDVSAAIGLAPTHHAGLPAPEAADADADAHDAAVKAVQFHPQGVAVRLNRAFPPGEQRLRGFQAGRTETLLDPVAWGVAGVAVGAAADAALHLAVGVGLKAV
jgi:hypothetical protein